MLTIQENWPAFLFGLFGLAFRWSRMGLPNSGNEPKSIFEGLVRLARLWVEATTGSLLLILGVLVALELFPAYNSIKFLAISLAAVLGAAVSDTLGRFIQNPVSVFNWIKEVALAWFGRSPQ